MRGFVLGAQAGELSQETSRPTSSSPEPDKGSDIVKLMTKAKATEHTVVIRSVHDERVPMSRQAKKQALELIRSTKK